MNVQLHSKNVSLTKGLEAYLQRRLHLTLARHTARIDHVRVSRFDVNGPRGGEDILCKIHTRIAGHDAVVEGRGDNPFRAISRACGRIGIHISGRVERLTRRRRRNQKPQPV